MLSHPQNYALPLLPLRRFPSVDAQPFLPRGTLFASAEKPRRRISSPRPPPGRRAPRLGRQARTAFRLLGVRLFPRGSPSLKEEEELLLFVFVAPLVVVAPLPLSALRDVENAGGHRTLSRSDREGRHARNVRHGASQPARCPRRREQEGEEQQDEQVRKQQQHQQQQRDDLRLVVVVVPNEHGVVARRRVVRDREDCVDDKRGRLRHGAGQEEERRRVRHRLVAIAPVLPIGKHHHQQQEPAAAPPPPTAAAAAAAPAAAAPAAAAAAAAVLRRGLLLRRVCVCVVVVLDRPSSGVVIVVVVNKLRPPRSDVALSLPVHPRAASS